MLNKNVIILLLLILFFSMTVSFAADNETQLEVNDGNDIIGDDVPSNATLLDGGTFEDIQKAVDQDEDTVNLTGTFNFTGERITVSKNVTFDGNQKTILDGNGNSGGFFFSGEGNTVIFKGLTFRNFNSSDEIIQIGYNSFADCSFIDCNFFDNAAGFKLSYYGDNSTFRYVNCNFSNNKDLGLTGDMENCNFVKNLGYFNILNCVNCSFMENKRFRISDAYAIIGSTFINNENTNWGIVSNASLIKDCNFTNNIVVGNGIVTSGNLVVGCIFENNSVKSLNSYGIGGYGGAISGSDSVINCTFIGNSASMWGGAIFGSRLIENCSFTNNKAAHAGAIYLSYECHDLQVVKNCIFSSNIADIGYSGAIEIFGLASISNCSFIKNSAKCAGSGNYLLGGGAISVRGTASIDSCNFESNFVENSGSAICVDAILEDQKITISNCNFTKNVANGNYQTTGYSYINYGNGLVYCVGEHPVSIKFINCKGIVKNTDKFKRKLIASVKSTSVAYKNYVIINLKDKAGHVYKNLKVKIKINGKSYSRTSDKNGQVKLKVSLPLKTYKMTVTYAGNNYNTKISKSFKITVKKAAPKFTAAAKTFKRSVKTKKYSLSLSANNAPMKNVKLTLKVSGKTFSAKTTSKGKATFKITNLKKKGTFKATVKYPGSKYYKKATKIVKISVK